MIELKDLLINFESILVSEEVKKDSIKHVVNKLVGINIKREDIEIKKGVICLNIKPIYKNEIFIKREKIIASLKEILGKKSPSEIR